MSNFFSCSLTNTQRLSDGPDLPTFAKIRAKLPPTFRQILANFWPTFSQLLARFSPTFPPFHWASFQAGQARQKEYQTRRAVKCLATAITESERQKGQPAPP